MYINEKINTANEISQKYKDILVRKAIIKAIRPANRKVK